MDKIVYKLVYNRKRTLNRRGMALVQVEAYQGGQKRYFSTNVYLQPEQWDTRRRRGRSPQNDGGGERRLYVSLGGSGGGGAEVCR